MSFLLSDYIINIVDCLHSTAPYEDRGAHLIRTSDIQNGRLILEITKKVSNETYSIWTQRAIPQEGDIIMAREAPVGGVGIVPKDTKLCLGQRTVQIIPNRELVDPYYLLYSLNHPKSQSKLNKISSGSTVKHINVKDIRNFEVPLTVPSLAKQRHIGNKIKLFDAKIQSNKDLVKSFELYSNLVFHKWFIEFNFPDKNGNPYKNSGNIMVESDGNSIPKEWAYNFLGNNDHFIILNIGVEPFSGKKKYVTTRDVENSNLSGNLEEVEFESRTQRANMQPVERSVWFAKMKDTKKRIDVIDFQDFENYIFSTGFAGIKCSELFFAYISSFVNRDEFERQKDNFSNGSTQKAINDSNIRKIKILIPDDETLQKFNKIILPLKRMIFEAKKENRLLETMRDLLIVKLIR